MGESKFKYDYEDSWIVDPFVKEIYGIRTSGKYGTLKQSYHEFYWIYGTNKSFGDIQKL